MRLLVTGGCGFIGTNFVLYMLEHHPDVEIVNLDKLTYAGNRYNLVDLEEKSPRYAFVHGDIGDRILVDGLLDRHEFHAVVNFAAESHVDRSIDDSSPFVETNIAGTHVLLEAARRHNLPRFVHISTDEVYGSLGPEGRFTESTPLAPNSPYSASKASADLLVRSFHKTYGMDTVITRCSNNYGPYQFPEKLIPLMYGKARSGNSLPVYGKGTNIRDWIHVLDHCRGVDLALRHGKPGGIYNFGGDAERTNIEVVRAILKHMGKPQSLITYVTDRPGHDLRYAMDYSLATRELGWMPAVAFEEGLKTTLAWYDQNQEWMEQVQSGAYRTFMDRWYGERT
ncbi:MAG: dTDP-glucose 4,6-dehydratase [Desulfovibrionales bacterium]